MNRILLLAAGLGAFSTFGQNFVHTPSQSRTDTVIMENFEAYDINFTTPNPEAITFEWQSISNTFHPNWSYSLCDQGGCYVGIPPNGVMSPISLAQAQSGMQGFLKLNITVGQNYGTGTAVFYVYDQNDYSRGDTVSFTVHWPAPPPVGIEEQRLDVSVYPNPVQDQLIIESKSVTDFNYEITNVIGKRVLSGQMNGNPVQRLDLSRLNSGIYFVSYYTSKQNRVTKRIVKR